MKHSFVALEHLLEKDPEAYLKEVRRLEVEDPKRLDSFVARMHGKVLAKGHIRRRSSIRSLVLADIKALQVPR